MGRPENAGFVHDKYAVFGETMKERCFRMWIYFGLKRAKRMDPLLAHSGYKDSADTWPV
jgi:hypothetical protein